MLRAGGFVVIVSHMKADETDDEPRRTAYCRRRAGYRGGQGQGLSYANEQSLIVLKDVDETVRSNEVVGDDAKPRGKERGIPMLKSCQYCGRVHDSKFDCGKRPKKTRDKSTDAYRVHRSNRWKNLSARIRDRDGYLCCVCRTGKYGTLKDLNSSNLSVHHIVPIEEDESRAFDEENLITLCDGHHRMAERGEIPRSELFALANPWGI